MDNQYDFQAFYLKLQEFIFKKSSDTTILEFMDSKNFSINNIISTLSNISDESDNRIESGVRIIELLTNNIESIKNKFLDIIKENSKMLEQIGHKLIKKFLIKFIMQNLESFGKDDYFYNLLLVYFLDDNIAVFELTMKLLLQTYKNKEFANHIKTNNILEKLFENMEKLKQKNYSIILIREIELMLKLINVRIDEEIENSQKSLLISLIKERCLSFDKLDILTQLAFLEVVEVHINNEDLLKILLEEFNFFNKVN